MSNRTGSQRLSATVLMAIEVEYLLDLHIEYVSTNRAIRHDPSKSVANALFTDTFNRYVDNRGLVQQSYTNNLNVNADIFRKEKIRLYRSITNFTAALEASDEDDDGLLASFRSRLDRSKTGPLEDFENAIQNLLSAYTRSIVTNLRHTELLSAFDELNTAAKIQYLNSVIGALSYTEVGTDYIKETSTLPRQLLEGARVNEIIDSIGVKVEEDANGRLVLSFADGELGEQFRSDVTSSIPATNNAPLIRAFTLLSYFAKDVIPAVWMSLLYQSTRGNSTLLRGEAENLIDRVFHLFLPASAIASFREANNDQELIAKIEEFKTKLGTMVGFAFDAMSIIAGIRASFVLASSAVNKQSPTAEDFKNALGAVNVINNRIESALTKGTNRKEISKKIKFGIGFVTLGIDIYIGVRNIQYAAIYGENMVIVGNLLVVSGSTIPVALGVAIRIGLVFGGPKVWIAGLFASTLSLIGGALISRGTRSEFEQFADYCYFGTQGIRSSTRNSNPDHIAYNFDHPNTRIALREQNSRMQTLLNPISFGFTGNRTAIIINYQHTRTINGVDTRWLPRSVITNFDVGLVENGGSHVGFASNNELTQFINNGTVSIYHTSEERQQFRNKWFQMTLDIGEGDDLVSLLDYSYYRRYFWEN